MRGAPPSFYALAGPLLLLLLLLLVSCRGFRPVPSSTRAGPGTVVGLALFRTHLIRDPLSPPPPHPTTSPRKPRGARAR